jgi:hypothetical protein
MWKNTVQPGGPQMTTWRRMHIAFKIPNAKNAQPDYVILITFPLQQWLHERVSMISYTHIVCLVYSNFSIWLHFCCFSTVYCSSSLPQYYIKMRLMP